MKKLLFTLVALLTMTGAWAATTTLTAQSFGLAVDANGSSYSDYTATGVTPAFKATMAGIGKYMQVRWSSGKEAGIWNTEAASDNVSKITFTFNPTALKQLGTQTRTIAVYGSNSAYESAANIGTGDTELGTIEISGDKNATADVTKTIDVAADKQFKFIGIRTVSGACYISGIEVTWGEGGGDTPVGPVEPIGESVILDFTKANYGMTPTSDGNASDNYVPDPFTLTDTGDLSVVLTGKWRLWATSSGNGLRGYKPSDSNSSEMTITAPEGKNITKVVFDGYAASSFSVGNDAVSTAWTGNKHSVVFKYTDTSRNNSLNSITVTLGEGGGDDPNPPTPTTPEYDNLSAWIAAKPAADAKVNSTVTAVYQNGKDLYITDNQDNFILVYGQLSTTYANGDVIPAGITGKYDIYGTTPEFIPAANSFAAGTPGTKVEAKLYAINDLKNDALISHFVRIEGVELTAIEGQTNKFTAKDAQGNEIVIYNKWNKTVTVTEGKNATITGFIQHFVSTKEGQEADYFDIMPILVEFGSTPVTPGTDDTATFDFSKPSTLNPTQNNPTEGSNGAVIVDGITFTANGVSLKNDKGATTPAPRLYMGNGKIDLRTFAGGTTTIAAPEGKHIGKIVFECSYAMEGAVKEANSGSITYPDKTITWTPSQTDELISSVTLTWKKYGGANGNSYSPKIDKVIVTLGEGGGINPPTPPATPEYDNLAAWMAAKPAADAKVKSTVTAVYQNGKDLYITDAQDNFILVYGQLSTTYANGDVIPAGITGKYDIYGTTPEFIPAANSFAAGTPGTKVEAKLYAINDLKNDALISHFVRIEGVELTAIEGQTNKFTAKDAQGNEIVIYNKWNKTVTVTEGKNATITGFIQHFVSTKEGQEADYFDIMPILVEFGGTPVTPGTDETATFDFSNPSSLNPTQNTPTSGQEGAISVDGVAFTANGVSLKNDKGSNNTTPRLYLESNGNVDLRVYAGGTTTIAAPEGKHIGKIVFECSYDMTGAVKEVNPGSVTYPSKTITWAPAQTDELVSSVTFTWQKYGENSYSPKINKAIVTLGDGGGENPPTPPVVSDEYDNLAAWIAAKPEADAKVNSTVTAVYQNGRDLYITDGQNNFILVYGDVASTYANGDVIPAGITGKYQLYGTTPEFIPVKDSFAAGTAGSKVQAKLYDINDLKNDAMISHYVRIEGVELVAIDGETNKFTAKDADGNEIVVYNKWNKTVEVFAGKDATVYGFIQHFVSTKEGEEADYFDIVPTLVEYEEAPIVTKATFDFTNPTGLNPAQNEPGDGANGAVNVDGVTFTSGIVSLTNAMGTNKTTPRIYKESGDKGFMLRLYAGNTTTIAVPEGANITSITFDAFYNMEGCCEAVSLGQVSYPNKGVTWTPGDAAVQVREVTLKWCKYTYNDVEYSPKFTTITVNYNVDTAIDTIDAADNTNAPVLYYDLQGRCVANPAPGQLVIRRQGTDIQKMIVR